MSNRDTDATRHSLAVLRCNRSNMAGLIMHVLLSELKGSNLSRRAKPVFTRGWRNKKSLIQSVGTEGRMERIMFRFIFRQQGGFSTIASGFLELVITNRPCTLACDKAFSHY